MAGAAEAVATYDDNALAIARNYEGMSMESAGLRWTMPLHSGSRPCERPWTRVPPFGIQREGCCRSMT